MSNPVLLAVNSGSSSVKLAVFDAALARIAEAEASGIGTGEPVRLSLAGFGGETAISLHTGSDHASAIACLADRVTARFGSDVAGIGHRVVHGGETFAEPVLVTPETLAGIARLAPLAPLHQPHNIAGIHAFGAAFPALPQVACFDTAFHRSIPEHRQLYALPPRFAEKGIRAYGFHGLSCTHVVENFSHLTGAPLPPAMVICHLGNGASVTAVRDGRSVANSMGFTPIDGLMMGSRSGQIDPGAVLALVDDAGGDTAAVSRLLNRDSGLLGVSCLSSDMRTLAASDAPAARLALDMFVDRVVRAVASAAAAAGGLDALVFTGGIGFHQAGIRARVIEALSWMGLELDPEANEARAATITRPGSPRAAHVVLADEEGVIARAVRAHVG